MGLKRNAHEDSNAIYLILIQSRSPLLHILKTIKPDIFLSQNWQTSNLREKIKSLQYEEWLLTISNLGRKKKTAII